MVNIDTVYQRVLAIANKEQRGYITPLEFNLLANQTQLSVFEQYFYDKNQRERIPGNDTDYSDVSSILNEKISFFERTDIVTGGQTLPPDLYRLGSIRIVDGDLWVEAEYIDHKDWLYIRNAPLLHPTSLRPVYLRDEALIWVYSDSIVDHLTTGVDCTYIRQPVKVEWAYDVIAEKALYNAGRTVHFEHHPSEETALVMQILELAGVIIEDPNVVQYANQKMTANIQQEKA
jgi:hypothetical protein